jgi:lipoprotein NlpI
MAKRIRLSKDEKLSLLLNTEDSNDGLFENSFIPLLSKYELKIGEKESHLKVLAELMETTKSGKGVVALRDLMLSQISEITKMEDVLLDAKNNEEIALKKIGKYFRDEEIEYTFSKPLKK